MRSEGRGNRTLTVSRSLRRVVRPGAPPRRGDAFLWLIKRLPCPRAFGREPTALKLAPASLSRSRLRQPPSVTFFLFSPRTILSCWRSPDIFILWASFGYINYD